MDELVGAGQIERFRAKEIFKHYENNAQSEKTRNNHNGSSSNVPDL